MIHDTQNTQMPQVQDGHNIYVTIKNFHFTNYQQNGVAETDALGHMMYSLHNTCTNETKSSPCIAC